MCVCGNCALCFSQRRPHVGPGLSGFVVQCTAIGVGLVGGWLHKRNSFFLPIFTFKNNVSIQTNRVNALPKKHVISKLNLK